MQLWVDAGNTPEGNLPAAISDIIRSDAASVKGAAQLELFTYTGRIFPATLAIDNYVLDHKCTMWVYSGSAFTGYDMEVYK